MKKIIRIALASALAIMASPGKAQTLTVCAGNSTVLTAQNTAGLAGPAYSLNPGGITSPNPSFTVSPASPTTYTLYVTGTNSNAAVVTISNVVTVQIAAVPVISLTPVSQTVGCGGGAIATATCVAITPSASVTHKWYSPASPSPISGSGQISTYPMSNISGSLTTFTCIVTDNVNGCSTSQTTQVISTGGLYPSFSVTSSQTFSLGCNTRSLTNISIVNAQAAGGGVVSYTVLPPGYTGGLSYTTNSWLASYSVTTPGTYTVIVKDNTNLCETRLPVAITQNVAAPGLAVSVPTQTLSCTMPSATLTGSSPNGVPGLVDFNWSYQNGLVIVNDPTLAVTVNPATALSSTLIGTYSLTVTDLDNACVSNTVLTMWQNTRPPNALISSLTLSTGCITGSVMLSNFSSTGILPNTFFISSPVVASLWAGPSPQPTVALSSTYVAQASGIYTMTAMDTNNGCTATATIAISSGPSAAFVHTITGGYAVFNDASTGTNVNTTYYWDFGDGITSAMQNPTHTYLNGGAHLVKLKVTDPTVLCVDSVIQSITVSGVPCSANSNFSMVPTATAQVWNVIPDYPWNIAAASWNWGDGSSSNTLYASHQYSVAGLYNICLSVTVSCVASSSTCTSYSVYRSSQEAMVLEVNVVAPGLIAGMASETGEHLSWNILPNPNAGEFRLSLTAAKAEPLRVRISDLTGRIVHEQSMAPDLISLPVQTSHLPSGLYLVTLEAGGLKATKRMIVSH